MGKIELTTVQIAFSFVSYDFPVAMQFFPNGMTISEYCTKPVSRDHALFVFLKLHGFHSELHGVSFEIDRMGIVKVSHINWRVSEASETLIGLNNGNRRYIYIYIYVYIVREASL